jgi:RNA polymerase sigma-70 factor (ECF subfamily)
MTDVSELDELVEEARQGSDNAFTALWRYFYPKMLRYLKMFTRDAEDLCSEVWVRIAGAMQSFVGNAAAFQGWIFTIARNLATDHARKRERQGETYEIDEASWIGYDTSNFDVEDLLRALPAEQAEIITLRIVVGLEVELIAQVTGKTPANIRVITHRGLAKLRTELAGIGGV